MGRWQRCGSVVPGKGSVHPLTTRAEMVDNLTRIGTGATSSDNEEAREVARTTSVMVDTVKPQASSRPWNERAKRAPRDERRRPSLVRLASTIGASFVLGMSAFFAGGPA